VFLQQLIFPSLHALKKSSLVAFIKSTRDFLLYNFFFSHSLCSELHQGTLLLLAPIVSLQYLVGSYGYSCTISVCSRAILVLQISPYSLLLCLTAAHPVTTFIQVKIGCQSLSLVVFLFHYQVLHQFSLREITVTESNFFGEITTPSDP
jgi:hypothetical protein